MGSKNCVECELRHLTAMRQQAGLEPKTITIPVAEYEGLVEKARLWDRLKESEAVLDELARETQATGGMGYAAIKEQKGFVAGNSGSLVERRRANCCRRPTWKELESRGFAEDANLENGRYMCSCAQCGCAFIGHKRRVVCKLCEERLEKERPPMPQVVISEERLRELETYLAVDGCHALLFNPASCFYETKLSDEELRALIAAYRERQALQIEVRGLQNQIHQMWELIP